MKKVTLGDVCNKAGSNIAQKDLQENEGKYPIYGASGLIKKVDFYQQELPYIAVVKDGAGIGRTMLLPGHSSVIGTVQYILPIDRETVDLKYLYYAIVHMNLSKYFSGATIPHIYYKDYKKEPLRLPELEKQREIAIVFQRIDELIAKREQQLKGLDELVKSRFIEMFGDENNSKKWDIVNVENVADVQVGVVIKPSQYYTDKNEGIKAFRSLNVGEGYIKDSEWVYFSKEGHQKNSKSILKENDLLIVRSGTPGTACVVTKDYVGSNTIDLIIAHPNCEKVNPYYLCTFTNMPHGKKQISEGIGGAAQQHFNVGKYNKLKLMLPPMKIQNKFVEFLREIDKSKLAVQKSLDELETLKKSLMQEYFG